MRLAIAALGLVACAPVACAPAAPARAPAPWPAPVAPTTSVEPAPPPPTAAPAPDAAPTSLAHAILEGLSAADPVRDAREGVLVAHRILGAVTGDHYETILWVTGHGVIGRAWGAVIAPTEQQLVALGVAHAAKSYGATLPDPDLPSSTASRVWTAARPDFIAPARAGASQRARGQLRAPVMGPSGMHVTTYEDVEQLRHLTAAAVCIRHETIETHSPRNAMRIREHRLVSLDGKQAMSRWMLDWIDDATARRTRARVLEGVLGKVPPAAASAGLSEEIVLEYVDGDPITMAFHPQDVCLRHHDGRPWIEAEYLFPPLAATNGFGTYHAVPIAPAPPALSGTPIVSPRHRELRDRLERLVRDHFVANGEEVATPVVTSLRLSPRRTAALVEAAGTTYAVDLLEATVQPLERLAYGEVIQAVWAWDDDLDQWEEELPPWAEAFPVPASEKLPPPLPR